MGECRGNEGPVAIGFDVRPGQNCVLPQVSEQFVVVGSAGVVPCAEDGGVYDDESTEHSVGRCISRLRVPSAVVAESSLQCLIFVVCSASTG